MIWWCYDGAMWCYLSLASSGAKRTIWIIKIYRLVIGNYFAPVKCLLHKFQKIQSKDRTTVRIDIIAWLDGYSWTALICGRPDGRTVGPFDRYRLLVLHYMYMVVSSIYVLCTIYSIYRWIYWYKQTYIDMFFSGWATVY